MRAMSHAIMVHFLPALRSSNSISTSRVANMITKSQYFSRLRNFHNSHHFSTAVELVDQKVVKVIESEIKLREQKSSQMLVAPPNDFPFNREATNDASIKFKYERNHNLMHGEHIEVCVWAPRELIRDHNDYGTNNNNNDLSLRLVVPLQVKIFNEYGDSMELQVLGNGDGIIVERIDVHVPHTSNSSCFEVHSTPNFKNLSRDVQDSIKEFIGIKGINKTNAEFFLNFAIEYYKYNRETNFLKAFRKCASQQV